MTLTEAMTRGLATLHSARDNRRGNRVGCCQQLTGLAVVAVALAVAATAVELAPTLVVTMGVVVKTLQSLQSVGVANVDANVAHVRRNHFHCLLRQRLAATSLVLQLRQNRHRWRRNHFHGLILRQRLEPTPLVLPVRTSPPQRATHPHQDWQVAAEALCSTSSCQLCACVACVSGCRPS